MCFWRGRDRPLTWPALRSNPGGVTPYPCLGEGLLDLENCAASSFPEPWKTFPNTQGQQMAVPALGTISARLRSPAQPPGCAVLLWKEKRKCSLKPPPAVSVFPRPLNSTDLVSELLPSLRLAWSCFPSEMPSVHHTAGYLVLQPERSHGGKESGRPDARGPSAQHSLLHGPPAWVPCRPWLMALPLSPTQPFYMSPCDVITHVPPWLSGRTRPGSRAFGK